MPQPRRVLICTVGTSMLTNLSGLKDCAAAELFTGQNWAELGRLLANRFSPQDRVLGAEINSLSELVKRKNIDLSTIYFMMSDTADAQKVKTILAAYLEQASWIGVEPGHVCFKSIDGLQDDRPDQFRSRGLRNLVREMAAVVRTYGSESVAIDATGGYKAQIALAVVLGQALDIPVYYKHERFKYIIELPPLPIALDYEVLGRNGWLLQSLEDNKCLTSDEIGDIDDEVKVLLQDVKVEKDTLWELSPVGQIYLEGFRQRVARNIDLQPAADRKCPTVPEHHRPKRYLEFVRKVWSQNPWISTCIELGIDNQRGMKRTRFFTRRTESGLELIGEYVSDYGARFRILTSSDKPHELVWAAMRLNEMYCR